MSDTIEYQINHTTNYAYDADIASCIMSVCMEPRNHGAQSVHDFRIQTNPSASFSVEFDAFGNRHHYFDVHQPHSSLEINVQATILCVISKFESSNLTQGVDALKVLEKWQSDWDLWDFLRPSELTAPSPSLDEWLSKTGLDSQPSHYERLIQLAQLLHTEFEYQPGATHVDSTIDHLLESRAGVCQDFAHLMISAARLWGIPARYISGYLYDSGEAGNRGASATHAWIECKLPGAGWLAFDPTNPKVDTNSLITVALGRDYRDVAPSRGITFGGATSELSVGVSVQRRLKNRESAPRHLQSTMQQQ